MSLATTGGEHRTALAPMTIRMRSWGGKSSHFAEKVVGTAEDEPLCGAKQDKGRRRTDVGSRFDAYSPTLDRR